MNIKGIDVVELIILGFFQDHTNVKSTNEYLVIMSIDLQWQVKDVMRKQEELPVCREGDLIMDQLVELTSKGCGCLLVIDDDYHLLGTFTDGDLRRTLKASKEGIFKLTVGEMCNR